MACTYVCVNCGCNVEDRLDAFYTMQDAFMRKLSRIQSDFPQEWPLDLRLKENQVECKHLVGDIAQELSEIVRELKNSKKHRQTDVTELDRPKLVEEAVDAFKFFLELLIFMGIGPQEFYDAYCAKDVVINDRLSVGY